MKMIRVLVQLPQPVKAHLEALCRDGYTASGYIRALIERDLGRRVTANRHRRHGALT